MKINKQALDTFKNVLEQGGFIILPDDFFSEIKKALEEINVSTKHVYSNKYYFISSNGRPLKKTEKKKCKNCSKEFLTRRKRNIFCSNYCRLHFKNRELWLKLKCLECGKEFKRYKSCQVSLKKHSNSIKNFCSDKCSRINYKKSFLKTVQCEICKKEYTRSCKFIKKTQAKICSKECSDKFKEYWKNGRRCIKCGRIREIRYFRELLVNKQRDYKMYASFCGFCRRRHRPVNGIEIGVEKIPYSRLKYKKHGI